MGGEGEEARNLEAVRALARLPGNDACADCGARFPRFASVTLGVFLCNRCYAIHRSVGAHVTRTKCIGLDTWRTPEVQLMRDMGNARAAQVWLGALPPHIKPPSPQSSDADVEKWIRDKYERRLYYCPQPQPTQGPSPPASGQEPHGQLSSHAQPSQQQSPLFAVDWPTGPGGQGQSSALHGLPTTTAGVPPQHCEEGRQQPQQSKEEHSQAYGQQVPAHAAYGQAPEVVRPGALGQGSELADLITFD